MACTRINTDDEIANEVDDFFDRHIDAIASAIREPDTIHTPHCTHGKRVWMFNRYWPFIHTWISTAVCLCDVNIILGVPKLNQVDLAGLSPRKQMKLVGAWRKYHEQVLERDIARGHKRFQRNIDDIVAILDGLQD